MKRIILSVTNDLVTDQRVHRVATSLMNHGADITLVGRLLPDSQPIKRDYAIHRMRLLFKKSSLFYAEYNIRLFFYLLFSKVDILVPNDLDTLLANYLVSVIRRKPLVYDAHEFFTEVPELIERKSVKTFWENIERRILPKLKHAYTVCLSISDIYYAKYHLKMNVVRNLPTKWDEIDRNNPYPGLPTSGFVLYQGSVNQGRGLELLVDAFEYVNDIKCVIIGDGDIWKAINQRIVSKNLQDKVLLLGKLPFHDLKRVTPHAALGISIEENLGLNYYYALPNKLFDYIQAQIPVLVSDFPEMHKIVTNYEVGEILVSREPRDLAVQLESMVQKSINAHWKTNLIKASSELCWEKEEKSLLEVYHKFI